MKTWLVFLCGLLCGVAGAVGVMHRLTRGSDVPRGAGVTTKVETTVPESVAVVKQRASGGWPMIAGKPDVEGATLGEKIALLRAAVAGTGPRLENYEYRVIIQAWAQEDAYGALEFVRTARRFPNRLDAVSAVLAVIGRTDLPGMWKWVGVNVEEADKEVVIGDVMDALSQEYPEATLACARGAKVMLGQERATAVAEQLARKSLEQCLAALESLERDEDRLPFARSMVGVWAEKDWRAAAEWCGRQRGGVLYAESVDELIRTVATSEPGAVGELLLRFADHAGNLGSEACVALLDTNPEQAGKWLAGVAPETAKRALSDWAYEGFEREPDRVVEMLGRFMTPVEQGELLETTFRDWLQSDAKAAEAWLKTVADPELAQRMQVQLLMRIAETDPAATLAVLQGRAPSEATNGIVSQALTAWLVKDAGAAGQWLEANAGQVPLTSVRSVAESYLNTNGDKATVWITQLPAGGFRDEAAASAVSHWVTQGESALATTMANAIGEPAHRLAALFEVYSGMRGSNHIEMAEEWLAKQGFAEEVKASWRAIAGR